MRILLAGLWARHGLNLAALLVIVVAVILAMIHFQVIDLSKLPGPR